MATKIFWIQIENRPWDVSPKNISRMTGLNIEQLPGKAPSVNVNLFSPETGVTKTREMFYPTNKGNKNPVTGEDEWQVIDALILRRYTGHWQAPDDRKVNPWDLNESDPTDNGTMGTVPGPTIECNVGDKVIVYFRNKDFRAGKDTKARTHSLHPHGIVFAPTSDGAYPLTPPDPAQPIPASERSAWDSVGVTGSRKQGDRVPPGGTFTYTWDTFGWPTTAGVWHYHDHSICDVENVILGAIAFLVIHNPENPDDVIEQDLPGGLPNGSLKRWRCFPYPFKVAAFPHDLVGLGDAIREIPPEIHGPCEKSEGAEYEKEAPIAELAVRRGELILELDKDLNWFVRLCQRFYVDPPQKAQYLQYYHQMPGVGMVINGRKYLGNTPTLIGGIKTKMRFGLAAMNKLLFHTFHLHGHRWVVSGPSGQTPGDIENSPQVQAVSQFEDTRTFGPANSFSFTINQGSFMGSVRKPEAPGLGEWHMHCHVLDHMMPGGMMASLLVIPPSKLVSPLLEGEPCPAEEVEIECAQEVTIGDSFFTPANVTINAGQTVCWINTGGAPHTVSSNKSSGQAFTCAPVSSEEFESGVLTSGDTFDHTYITPGNYAYHCEIHGCGMAGTVTVNP